MRKQIRHSFTYNTSMIVCSSRHRRCFVLNDLWARVVQIAVAVDESKQSFVNSKKVSSEFDFLNDRLLQRVPGEPRRDYGRPRNEFCHAIISTKKENCCDSWNYIITTLCGQQ